MNCFIDRLPDELLILILRMLYKPFDGFKHGDLNDAEPLEHSLVSRRWRRLALASWNTRSFAVDWMSPDPSQFLFLPDHPSLDVIVSTGNSHLGTPGQKVREQIVLDRLSIYAHHLRTLNLHVHWQSISTFKPLFSMARTALPRLRVLLLRAYSRTKRSNMHRLIFEDSEALFANGTPLALEIVSCSGIQPRHILHCGSITALRLTDVPTTIESLLKVFQSNPNLAYIFLGQLSEDNISKPTQTPSGAFFSPGSLPMSKLRRLELFDVDLNLENLLVPLDTAAVISIDYSARHDSLSDAAVRKRRGLDTLLLAPDSLSHLRSCNRAEASTVSFSAGAYFTQITYGHATAPSSTQALVAGDESRYRVGLRIKFRRIRDLRKETFLSLSRASTPLTSLRRLRVTISHPNFNFEQAEWRAVLGALPHLHEFALEIDDLWEVLSALKLKLKAVKHRTTSLSPSPTSPTSVTSPTPVTNDNPPAERRDNDDRLLCPTLHTLTVCATGKAYQKYQPFGLLFSFIHHRRKHRAPLTLLRIATTVESLKPLPSGRPSEVDTNLRWFEKEMDGDRLGQRRREGEDGLSSGAACQSNSSVPQQVSSLAESTDPSESTKPLRTFIWDLGDAAVDSARYPPPEALSPRPTTESPEEDGESEQEDTRKSTSPKTGHEKSKDKGKGKRDPPASPNRRKGRIGTASLGVAIDTERRPKPKHGAAKDTDTVSSSSKKTSAGTRFFFTFDCLLNKEKPISTEAVVDKEKEEGEEKEKDAMKLEEEHKPRTIRTPSARFWPRARVAVT